MLDASREFEFGQLIWPVVPGLLASLVLCACTAVPSAPVESPEPTAAATTHPGDVQRIGELERQLSQRQRQCAEDKRRLERDLRESQKRSDDLQKKLNAVLAIDRELRRGSKGR